MAKHRVLLPSHFAFCCIALVTVPLVSGVRLALDSQEALQERLQSNSSEAAQGQPPRRGTPTSADANLALDLLNPERVRQREREAARLKAEENRKYRAADKLRKEHKCQAPYSGYENRTKTGSCETAGNRCSDSFEVGTWFGGWWCGADVKIHYRDESGRYPSLDRKFNFDCEYYYFWYSRDGSTYEGTNPELFVYTTGLTKETTKRCKQCKRTYDCST